MPDNIDKQKLATHLRDIKDEVAMLVTRMNQQSLYIDKLRSQVEAMRRELNGTFIPNIERRSA